jgi:quercetin dioxygenase-like cupin family protein
VELLLLALRYVLNKSNRDPLPREFVDAWTHEGFEAAYVVSGEVEIDVNGTITRLAAGDSVSYDARLPHRHRTVSRRPARLLLIETSTRHPHL